MAHPIPSVLDIERYVRERRDTDQPLIGWGVYFFVLQIVTFGIYDFIVFTRRTARAEAFRGRKSHYYDAIITFSKQYGEETGQLDAVYDAISDLENYKKDRFSITHKPFNPGKATLLTIVTLGVYGFITVARLMRFWWEIQVTEQDFDEGLAQIWTKLGVIRYPISFRPDQQLRRNFWTYFILSTVTLGIYGIVWDHKMHTDPDKIYPEFHSVEDTVLNSARSPGSVRG